jgi:hypothetical protein
LVYFEVPTNNNLLTVEQEAFGYCKGLYKGIDEDLTRQFFSKLKTIGEGAFEHVTEGFTAGIFISNNTEIILSGAFFNTYMTPKIEFGTLLNPVSLTKISFYNVDG